MTAIGTSIGIPFSKSAFDWISYWSAQALAWYDGTTEDGGVTLVDKSENSNNAILTDNLITNPTLEDDYLSLSNSNPAVPCVTNERSSTQKHAGTYSRHIVLNGSNTGIKTYYSTKTGETITYSFWTYGVGGSGTLRYAIYKGDGSGILVPQTSCTYAVGMWLQTTNTYVETAGGNVAYIQIYCTTATSKEFYVDDITALSSEGKVACVMPENNDMLSVDTDYIFYNSSGFRNTVRLKTKERTEGYNRSLFVFPDMNIYFASSTLSYKDYVGLIDYLDYPSLFYEQIENEVTVGSDGDYATIALALAGITDANYLNRYKITVLDNFTITELAEFTVIVGNFHRFIDMKDYCYINGNNKTLTCSIPNTATDEQTWYYEPAASNAMTGARNLSISMKNGRYPMHIDSNANIGNRQEFFNCSFTNYSTQEVIDYRIAHAEAYNGVYQGHVACGHGIYGGQTIYYKECTMSGIHGFSLHTAANQASPSYLYLLGCNIISLPIVQANYNPTGAIMSSVDFVCYTSQQINNAYILGGTINGGIQWDAWYVEPTATDLYILNDITVNIYSNTALFSNVATVGGALKIVAATGVIDTVAGTGATALTSATCDYDSNYALGRLEVGEEWEAYNADINMGTRLGDCSGINKVMTLNVNSVEKTITFDEDFTSQDNDYCLAFINTALAGSAIASLYQRAQDYTPTEL